MGTEKENIETEWFWTGWDGRIPSAITQSRFDQGSLIKGNFFDSWTASLTTIEDKTMIWGGSRVYNNNEAKLNLKLN